MSHRDVHIHIEALILRGFAPGDRARIADGLQRELERLVAERVPKQWTRSANVEHLRIPEFRLAPAAPAEHVGEQIARSLHGATKEPLR